MSKTYIFNIPSIVCSACSALITNALNSFNSVDIKLFSVDGSAKKLVVIVDDDVDDAKLKAELANCLGDFDHQCEFESVRSTISDNSQDRLDTMRPDLGEIEESASNTVVDGQLVAMASVKPTKKPNAIRRHVIKGVIGLATGAALMVLMVLMSYGFAIPMIAMYGIVGAASAMTLALGASTYLEATKALIKSKFRSFNMQTLFTLSTLTVVGLSIAHLFVSWITMMPDAALLILGFYEIGNAIKAKAEENLAQALCYQDQCEKIVKRKRRLPSDEEVYEDTPVEQLKRNHVIRLSKGQVVPVNGLCLNTSVTHIYRSILDGSTDPVEIVAGDRIVAGMKVPDHVEHIDMIVTHDMKNSLLKLRQDEVSLALAEKSQLEKKTDKILTVFVPVVMGLSIIGGIVIGATLGIGLGLQFAVTMMSALCPCALGLSVPMGVKNGIKKGLDYNVRFRSGEKLQEAHKCSVVVADMNGTFTKGKPGVTSFEVKDPADTRLFLRCLALMEAKSEKPIGKAIYKFAEKELANVRKQRDIANSRDHGKEEAEDAAYVPAAELDIVRDTSSVRGIKSVIDGQECLVGNADYLAQQGIEIAPEEIPVSIGGEQVTYLVLGNGANRRIVGHIKTRDQLRKDAKVVVQELQEQMGKEVHLCTGSEKEVAWFFADQLGIPRERVRSSASSQDKKAYIEQLQRPVGAKKPVKVCFVGEGGNDLPGMAVCDFGVTIRSNALDPSTERVAGAGIEGTSSLKPLLNAFAISKQTDHGIRQNLMINIVYNTAMILVVGGLLVAVGFALNPAIGAALMVVQVGLILLNQWRIHRQKLAHEKRYEIEMQKIKVLEEVEEAEDDKSLDMSLASEKQAEQEKLLTSPQVDGAACLPDNVVRASSAMRQQGRAFQAAPAAPALEGELPELFAAARCVFQ